MFKVIPAIDIIEGKCVRLTQGDYQQKKIYNSNPLEVAREFEAMGLEYLHLVDLDGAKAGKVINWRVIESICSRTKLKVDFGGGLKTSEEVKKVFELGVLQITGGSIAVKNPSLFLEWLQNYGPGKIILGADVKNQKIAVSGWQEETTLEVQDFLRNFIEKGILFVICTDISKDGLLEGPSIELYARLKECYPTIKFIASGGVASLDDLKKLYALGMEGVITGKALYEQKISLKELSEWMKEIA